MIDEALEFLAAQLNEYLRMKTTYPDIVVLRRMSKKDGTEVDLSNKVVFQLVNIEEERIGKAQIPLGNPIGSNYPVRNPDLKLNLYVLFSAMDSDDDNDSSTYLSAVKLLSRVVKYFQHKHFFTTVNSPSLPVSIGQLIVEMHPVSLENQNYIWASLGVKYRPSVVYKIRLITITDDEFNLEVPAPRELGSNISTT